MKPTYLFSIALLLQSFFCMQPIFAQWTPILNISPNAVSAGLNESMGSCLGASNDTVHVVWTDKISSTHAILYYRRSVDTGVSWNVPMAITPASGNAWNPAIAVSGRNVHVAWREIDTITGHRASWYKHSLDGGNTWSQNIFLDSTADWPAIAVSGNKVFIANDVIVSQAPYNTEIFFMCSLDNGQTWSAPQQLTNADGRSEDESIAAEGSHIHMSWNDKRTGQFQIFYKESSDYGLTWGPDVVVDLPYDYNTMVCSDGAHVDVISCGAASGHYQLLLAQSPDTGATWPVMNMDLSNDTAHTYFLPHMTRDGSNLHIITSSSAGSKYFHSGDGGMTWDVPAAIAGASFITYSGCALHVIYYISGHIFYLRNPTGNAGAHCSMTTDVPKMAATTNWDVFPNPAKNLLTINASTLSLNSKITIADVLGRIIYQQKQTFISNSIDVSKWGRGIYFLRITTDQETAVKKIIVE